MKKIFLTLTVYVIAAVAGFATFWWGIDFLRGKPPETFYAIPKTEEAEDLIIKLKVGGWHIKDVQLSEAHALVVFD
jgi:hypothetical protein